MKQYLSTLSILFTFIAFFLSGTPAEAQKFGHINSAELMAELPAIIAADAQLKVFQDQLSKTGQDMYTKLETDYNDYLQKVNSGTLSQLQASQIEADLQQAQLSIQQYQQEAQQKVMTKRQELYEPIFEKVRKIIEEYGKANGYTMIFDSSLGAILFENSEDLTELIKGKL